MVINKGDKFIALVDFYMNSDVERKQLKYKKGKVYLSEKDDCITNEQGNKSHVWTNIFYRGEQIFEKYENVVTTEQVDSTKALRYNSGKPQWSLAHFKSLEPMVKVLEFGAQKYDRDNWKKDMDLDKILDSAQRHLSAMIDGENIDPESGELHAGHVLCNMMFYVFHYNKNKCCGDWDSEGSCKCK